MPLARILSLAAVTIALAGGFTVHQFASAPAVQAQAAARVYELRTYTAAPGKFDALNTRFRDHTVRLFAKHGVKNITYWTPTEGPLMGNTLVYVIPHASREAAKTFWSAFQSDPEWIKAKAASEANGPLTTKVESVFMTTPDSSAM
jgi:hypothetical protein